MPGQKPASTLAWASGANAFNELKNLILKARIKPTLPLFTSTMMITDRINNNPNYGDQGCVRYQLDFADSGNFKTINYFWKKYPMESVPLVKDIKSAFGDTCMKKLHGEIRANHEHPF